MRLHFAEKLRVRRQRVSRNEFGETEVELLPSRTIRATYYPGGDSREVMAGGLRRVVKYVILTPDRVRGLEVAADADEVRIGRDWLQTVVIRTYSGVGTIPTYHEVGAVAGA